MMPTVRTPLRRRRNTQITAEILSRWRDCRELQDAAVDRIGEAGGGRREEYLGKSKDLRRMLGLMPWEPNPLEVDDGPNTWSPHLLGSQSWPRAVALRRRLSAADVEQ